MKRGLWITALIALAVLPMAFVGCKNKAKESPEMPKMEMADSVISTSMVQEMQVPVEPAQAIATEAIPPTAAAAGPAVSVTQEKQHRNKDIQRALKKAGFYAGAIDGKIGPKTRKAIEEFQKSMGLVVDGKVGPKTWAELEKYLLQQ